MKKHLHKPLSLNAETIRSLRSSELAAVEGGLGETALCPFSKGCPFPVLTEGCPSGKGC